MSNKSKTHYPGGQIDVEWDERLCIPVGECGQAKDDLFVAGHQPCSQPDLARPEDIVDVVARCPSGALTVVAPKQEIKETLDKRNKVTVSYCGPYFRRLASSTTVP